MKGEEEDTMTWLAIEMLHVVQQGLGKYGNTGIIRTNYGRER